MENKTGHDDNSCYRNVCKMSVVSFALAVVFIIKQVMFYKTKLVGFHMLLKQGSFFTVVHTIL